ncbi:MAG: bifunctional nuclease domain-containing protein [Candidatus Neomarinimicrobiota bacterium]
MQLVPVTVAKITFHAPSHSYAVLLSEIGGPRSLPVIVGAYEAQAIALAVENIKTPRPLTHDLLSNLIDSLTINLVSAVITDLKDGVYYARLEFSGGGIRRHSIDSRPSDAIAIALRLGTPMFVAETVLREAAIETTKSEPEIGDRPEEQGQGDRLYLEQQLARAVEREEYETAAELRDKIRQLDS